VRSISFMPVKTNNTCYTTVCGTDDAGGGKECLWRIHALAPKNSSGYFKIKKIVWEHTCHKAVLQSNHRQATSSFVCNVIMPMMRDNLDLILENIIAKINNKFHITITYSNAWHARTKALSKIFGDWKLSYATLPQYLEAIKNSNTCIVTCLKVEPYAFEYGSIVPNMVQFSRVFWVFDVNWGVFFV